MACSTFSTALSQVAAIDALTGRTLWVHDPKIYEDGTPRTWDTSNYEELKPRGARTLKKPKDYPYAMRDFDIEDLDRNHRCSGLESTQPQVTQ